MQLTLINVLIFIALATAGGVSGAAISLFAHLSRARAGLLEAVSSGAAVLTLASPIYQHFRFRPLWLPRCPECRKIPNAYHVMGGGWPRFHLACAKCGQEIIVFIRRCGDQEHGMAALPTFCLRWPEFIGLWRRIS